MKVSPAFDALIIGDTLTLHATVDTAGAATSAVRWSSSDSSVMAVSPTGQVQALSGSWLVRVCAVSVFDSGQNACAALSIRGLPPKFPNFAVVPGGVAMVRGDSLRLTAALGGTAGSQRGITWSSSDTLQATVSADGLVRAQALLGPVWICATTYGDVVGRGCAWILREPPDDIVSWLVWLGPSSLTLNVGEQGTLYPFVQTIGGIPLALEWTSSDTASVTVDGGRVTARAVTSGARVCAQPIAKPRWRSCAPVVVAR